MYLAENLKYLREQRGFNQKELSDALGMSRAAIGNWEKQHRIPDIETIIKMAQFFDVTLDDFILKELRPPTPLYAKNLRYLRAKHEMTQENMADLLGYRGKQGYGAVETGKTRASVEDLEKLADFFGVTMDQLIKQNLSREDSDGKTK